MSDSYLSLGSNMTNRIRNLETAIELINNTSGIKIKARSKIYESQSMYDETIDDFCNLVLKIETILSPKNLLTHTQEIEKKMGRTRSMAGHHQSRIIDIDILSFNTEVIRSETLTIPHPRIKERKFVLKPWTDIDSEYVLPESNRSIADLLMDIKDDFTLKLCKQ